MGELQSGDRVRVALVREGEVSWLNGDGSVDVQFDGQAHALEYVPLDAITKIVPALAVGDIIPERSPDPQLPNGTVLVYDSEDQAAIQKHDGLWYFTANFTEHGFEWENVAHSPLRVVFIQKGYDQ